MNIFFKKIMRGRAFLLTKKLKFISILLSILLAFTLISPINSYASSQPVFTEEERNENNQSIIPKDKVIEGSPIDSGLILDDGENEVQPHALPFLIPVATPIIARIGGQIFVKAYLKNTTKNIIVRNHSYASRLHPSGVIFNKDGFPVFPYKYQTKRLPNSKLKESNYQQFKWSNAELKYAVNNTPGVKSKFNVMELNDIQNGKTPAGYTWHHHQNTGIFQLVKTDIHKATGHTGGRSIWGSLE